MVDVIESDTVVYLTQFKIVRGRHEVIMERNYFSQEFLDNFDFRRLYIKVRS